MNRDWLKYGNELDWSDVCLLILGMNLIGRMNEQAYNRPIKFIPQISKLTFDHSNSYPKLQPITAHFEPERFV